MVVKYVHHGDDLVEHQNREASFEPNAPTTRPICAIEISIGALLARRLDQAVTTPSMTS